MAAHNEHSDRLKSDPLFDPRRSAADAALVEAMKEALREVLPPIVEEAVRRQLPRMVLGEDMPLDLQQVVEMLPISGKQLRRLRRRGAFRMLRLPNTDKPVATLGQIRAFIRRWELED